MKFKHLFEAARQVAVVRDRAVRAGAGHGWNRLRDRSAGRPSVALLPSRALESDARSMAADQKQTAHRRVAPGAVALHGWVLGCASRREAAGSRPGSGPCWSVVNGPVLKILF